MLAVDFNPHEDRLEIGAGVLANVATVEDVTLDLVPILGQVAATDLFGPELKAKRDLVEDGGAIERDLGFLLDLQPDAEGRILAEATVVTLQEGDQITVIGVSSSELLSLIA